MHRIYPELRNVGIFFKIIKDFSVVGAYSRCSCRDLGICRRI